MNRVGLGLAIGAGYVLGRTRKLKMAFAVGTLVAGKRMHLSPRALADLVSRQLLENPQFKEIGDQMREDLRGVGKAASGALVERQIDALSDRLHGRTAQVRDQLAGAAPDVTGLFDEEEDEAEDDESRTRREDESRSRRESEAGEANGADEADHEEERGERAERKAPAAAKKAARKAPAKKTAEKKPPAGKAPAKKAAAKKTAAKKTAAKKSTAARGAARGARTRLPKGGGER